MFEDEKTDPAMPAALALFEAERGMKKVALGLAAATYSLRVESGRLEEHVCFDPWTSEPLNDAAERQTAIKVALEHLLWATLALNLAEDSLGPGAEAPREAHPNGLPVEAREVRPMKLQTAPDGALANLGRLMGSRLGAEERLHLLLLSGEMVLKRWTLDLRKANAAFVAEGADWEDEVPASVEALSSCLLPLLLDATRKLRADTEPTKSPPTKE